RVPLHRCRHRRRRVIRLLLRLGGGMSIGFRLHPQACRVVGARGTWGGGAFRLRAGPSGPSIGRRKAGDVLKLVGMAEYSRAGRALMRQEVVARGTESTLSALDRLHPDGAAALEALRVELEDEELAASTPLDRGIFMHAIGADETGRVKRGSAADAEDLYELCNASWSGTLFVH
ncbi:MAG: hypothetical protein SGPRY_009259, partial [Prymnesium sp.]